MNGIKMRPFILLLPASLCLFPLDRATTAAEPVHRWVFSPKYVKERVLLPETGNLKGTIHGPFKSLKEPDSLGFIGSSKAGNEIILSADLDMASLPRQALTVEAWVMIDRPHLRPISKNEPWSTTASITGRILKTLRGSFGTTSDRNSARRSLGSSQGCRSGSWSTFSGK